MSQAPSSEADAHTARLPTNHSSRLARLGGLPSPPAATTRARTLVPCGFGAGEWPSGDAAGLACRLGSACRVGRGWVTRSASSRGPRLPGAAAEEEERRFQTAVSAAGPARAS